MTADGVDELGRRVRQGVSKLRGLEVGGQLEVEILSQLVDGKKTIAEVVELIYGLERCEEGFNSCYTRAWRATKRLESKGLVSTRIFGKEKPYRLTNLAIMNLAKIGGEEKQITIVSRSDLIFYLVTIAVAAPIASLGTGWFELTDPSIAALFACFYYLLGVSTSRIIQTLRKVL